MRASPILISLMFPKAARSGPLSCCRSNRDRAGRSAGAPPALAFYADHLAKRVDDFDKIALRRHDRVDVLIRHRRFVDDVGILPALDALCRLDVILDREPALRFRARHRASGAVRAGVERLLVAEAAHDIGARAHAPRNDSEIALARTDRALARHPYIRAAEMLARDVVVMAVDGDRAPLEL